MTYHLSRLLLVGFLDVAAAVTALAVSSAQHAQRAPPGALTGRRRLGGHGQVAAAWQGGQLANALPLLQVPRRLHAHPHA